MWAARTPLCARRGAVVFAKPEHFAAKDASLAGVGICGQKLAWEASSYPSQASIFSSSCHIELFCLSIMKLI